MASIDPRASVAFFFERIDVLHARSLLAELPPVIALLDMCPQEVREGVPRLGLYFRPGIPADNWAPALTIIVRMAEHAPSTRAVIKDSLGGILRSLRDLPGPLSDAAADLLAKVDMPPSQVDVIADRIVRAAVDLGQRGILVAGAGLSYDTMPVTSELRPILARVLGSTHDDPVGLIDSDDERAWRLTAERWETFQPLFAGWSLRQSPGVQHVVAMDWLHLGRFSRIISFNWDDLFERAHLERFGVPVAKWPAARDAVLVKPHGDVEDPETRWVYPYEQGIVPGELLTALTAEPPAFALIVGYSERDPDVKLRLIDWLDRHVAEVFRVRPSLDESTPQDARTSAGDFFARLQAAAHGRTPADGLDAQPAKVGEVRGGLPVRSPATDRASRRC